MIERVPRSIVDVNECELSSSDRNFGKYRRFDAVTVIFFIGKNDK